MTPKEASEWGRGCADQVMGACKGMKNAEVIVGMCAALACFDTSLIPERLKDQLSEVAAHICAAKMKMEELGITDRKSFEIAAQIGLEDR